ncbi:MAG TPA: hypothetical protein VGA80_07845, partial [Flavobacteriaceae bacterium]
MLQFLSSSKIKLLSGIILAVCLQNCNEKNTQNISTPETKTDWGFTEFVKVDSINPILNPTDELEFTDPITGS